MATIEEALQAKLVATATVTALAGARIYPAAGSQVASTSDYVTYEKVDGAPVHDMAGASGLSSGRWTLMAHSTSYAGAKTLANAVRAALDGFRGTQSGLNVGSVLCVAEEDLYDPETRQHLVAVDFMVYYGA